MTSENSEDSEGDVAVLSTNADRDDPTAQSESSAEEHNPCTDSSNGSPLPNESCAVPGDRSSEVAEPSGAESELPSSNAEDSFFDRSVGTDTADAALSAVLLTLAQRIHEVCAYLEREREERARERSEWERLLQEQAFDSSVMEPLPIADSFDYIHSSASAIQQGVARARREEEMREAVNGRWCSCLQQPGEVGIFYLISLEYNTLRKESFLV